jgi:hypothetical protein
MVIGTWAGLKKKTSRTFGRSMFSGGEKTLSVINIGSGLKRL